MIIESKNTDIPVAGFQDPIDDAQSVFRNVLDAMSHPGKIVTVNGLDDAPSPLNKATASICLSLVDFETPLWMDTEIAVSGETVNFLRFHCGCPITTDSKEAKTALLSNPSEMTSFKRFYEGCDERPDLSATLIIQVDGLSNEDGVKLSGPGIKNSSLLNVDGLPEQFWNCVHENHGLFPRGVDLILTANEQMVCLPRTTKVEV